MCGQLTQGVAMVVELSIEAEYSEIYTKGRYTCKEPLISNNPLRLRKVFKGY